MDDQDISVSTGVAVYLSAKGNEVLGKARAMGQNRANFIGALIERYGDAYLAELRKMGIREAPSRKKTEPRVEPQA